MVWINYTSLTLTDDWALNAIVGGAQYTWFRVNSITDLPSPYLVLLGVANGNDPNEVYDIRKFFPSIHAQCLPVYLPPSFNNAFYWIGRVARWYRPSNPITLSIDYWQP